MTTTHAVATDEVLNERRGSLGRITLNRPKAINALSRAMIDAVHAQLDAWALDDDVKVVVLDGAGERGFCAGGDIKALYESAHDVRAHGEEYWRAEYELDAAVARYPKPVVAIMDGVVMGGGVGLAGHASHRVATERLKTAMPEVGIGFTPDVGGTWLLSRAPGELGTYLALTGTVIGADDALLVGMADTVITSERIDELVTALEAGDPEAALAQVGARDVLDESGATLVAARPWIDAAFANDRVEDVLAALDARAEDDAHTAAGVMRAKSPTSLKVALRTLRTAADLGSLEACLDMEFRAVCRFLRPDGDFVEGIRAQVVDKDRNPSWNPATLAAVSDADVDAYMALLTHIPELGLGARTA